MSFALKPAGLVLLLLFSTCLLTAFRVQAGPATTSPTTAIAPTGTIPTLPASFATSAFAPSVTYTPPTTFPSASRGVATTITGLGPSAAGGSAYTFTYGVPISSVQPTVDYSLSSSLSANGQPLGPSASNLIPDPQHLQHASAPRLSSTEPTSALFFSLCAAAAVAGVLRIVI